MKFYQVKNRGATSLPVLGPEGKPPIVCKGRSTTSLPMEYYMGDFCQSLLKNRSLILLREKDVAEQVSELSSEETSKPKSRRSKAKASTEVAEATEDHDTLGKDME